MGFSNHQSTQRLRGLYEWKSRLQMHSQPIPLVRHKNHLLMCRTYFSWFLIRYWRNYDDYPPWDEHIYRTVDVSVCAVPRVCLGFNWANKLWATVPSSSTSWRVFAPENTSVFTRRRRFGSSIFILIYCTFFLSISLSSCRDLMQLSPVQPLSPLTSDLSWPHTPAQMVFPKINHGFLSADQQLIKRRLIKVVLVCFSLTAPPDGASPLLFILKLL